MSDARKTYGWLLLCLIAQAVLLTHRLDLLPIWDDELFTVRVAQQPVQAMIETVRGDVHPPLYFLLAHYWIKILSGDVLVQLRLLSVVFALLATIALDRLWLKNVPPRVRGWCLALWILSACVLLYARMARSYSFQTLGFIVVCWAAWRWSQEFGSWRRMLVWAGSAAVLLYTHYVPGFAAWAGVNVLLFQHARQRPGRWLIGNAVVLVAYLPWLATLFSVLRVWQTRPSPHFLTANLPVETGIKLFYACFSFLFGEAIPVWMLPVTGLLAIPIAWLLWTGSRAGRTWLLPLVVTAAIGFAGVAGWVSYAFGPARLLFLLPLALLALAVGACRAPRAGSVIAAALLAANVIGIGSYFKARDLLNIGYLAPMDRVGKDIATSSSPADTLVLVDGPNLSAVVLEHYLPGFSTRHIYTEADAEAARREIANPAIRHVWFMRNPHDVTPGRVLERLETDLRSSWQGQMHPYMSFSPTHRALMRAMNVQVSCDWLYAAWEFRKSN